MKITTKILTSLAIALVASASFATVDSYLYWMVDKAKFGDTPAYFDYATVSIDGGETYLNLYDGAESLDSGKAGSVEDGVYWSTDAYYAGYDSSDTFSTFLVELWVNGQSDSVGWQSYSAAGLGKYIAGGMNQVGSPLVVSQVVPEPTSGLLSLFGLAALALRRRRRA